MYGDTENPHFRGFQSHKPANSVKQILRTSAILLALFTFAMPLIAQDELRIQGIVKDDETLKKMQGVTVIVLQNGSQFDAMQTNGGGKYEFSLPLGYVYDIRFTRNGMVAKTVRFDTTGIPEEDQAGGFQSDMGMNLFPMIEGFDTSITDEPIGLAAFDEQKNSIEFDYQYTSERQRLIEAEQKRLEDLAENMEKMLAKFEEFIRKGDGKMDTEKYQDALKYYSDALGIFPADEGAIAKRDAAQAKIDEADAAARLEADYQAAMALGTNHMKGSKWEDAIAAYETASSLKPSEKEPKDKIIECQNNLAAMADKDAFDALIDEADALFRSEDYALSIDKYKEAQKLISEDKYAREQIKEAQIRLDALLADAAAREEMQRRYDEFMTLGANNFKAEDYTIALRNYQDAQAIFRDKREPQVEIDKIQDILSKLDADAAANADADAARLEQERIDKEYNALLASADQKFDAESLESARADYEAALVVKPGEKYPKSRITRINDLLDRLAQEQADESERQNEADTLLAAEEEARLATEERERMAEEERQRRLNEERQENLRLADEAARKEEEDRLRRERMLSNIDRSKEDEVDRYFREAKEREEAARREKVDGRKEGVQDLIVAGADQSAEARTDQTQKAEAKVDNLEEIRRNGEYNLEDKQQQQAQEGKKVDDFNQTETEASKRNRLRNEADAHAQEAYTNEVLDKQDQRDINLNTFERESTAHETEAQRQLGRSKTLRQDKEFDVRQSKELDQNTQSEGRTIQERKADDREGTKDQEQEFQQDAAAAAAERRTTSAEDKQYDKEKAETIQEDKTDLTIDNQARIQRQKSGNENLISDRALDAQRRSYDRQKEAHTKDSGSPKDQEDFLPKEGTDDLPEGVSEKSYELGNKIVIERTVKDGNKVDVYKKVVSKAGTYYFKNGQSITEQTWKEETLDVRD